MEGIIISDEVEAKIEKLKADGADKLHIVADFDRTLTRFKLNGEKAIGSFDKLNTSGYFSKEYGTKYLELYDHYYPLEISDEVPVEKKKIYMVEWWEKHMALILKEGLTKEMITSIFQDDSIFRDDIDTFFELVDGHMIPLLIFSAGIGDSIEVLMEKRHYLADNIHIVSNFFIFDDEGTAIDVKRPFIHSYSKNEHEIENTDYLQSIKEKPNVILLGDSLGDLGMTEGIDHDTVLKIGFLNDNIENLRDDYEKAFDIVIMGSESIQYVNEILARIL